MEHSKTLDTVKDAISLRIAESIMRRTSQRFTSLESRTILEKCVANWKASFGEHHLQMTAVQWLHAFTQRLEKQLLKNMIRKWVQGLAEHILNIELERRSQMVERVKDVALKRLKTAMDNMIMKTTVRCLLSWRSGIRSHEQACSIRSQGVLVLLTQLLVLKSKQCKGELWRRQAAIMYFQNSLLRQQRILCQERAAILRWRLQRTEFVCGIIEDKWSQALEFGLDLKERTITAEAASKRDERLLSMLEQQQRFIGQNNLANVVSNGSDHLEAEHVDDDYTPGTRATLKLKPVTNPVGDMMYRIRSRSKRQ